MRRAPDRRLEYRAEVVGMRAVHHEVGRRRVGGGVDRGHRLGERGPVGQGAVGLDRERDHDRHVARLGGADDTDRLGAGSSR